MGSQLSIRPVYRRAPPCISQGKCGTVHYRIGQCCTRIQPRPRSGQKEDFKGERHGDQKSRVAALSERARGLVHGDRSHRPFFTAPDPALVASASVTFEPGARTAWHTHPLGQTLIVTAGCGWAQRESGPVEEIHPGDVIWIPPHEKHWHGATPTTAMTHMAIQERKDGKMVDWMEHVSDEQYRKA